LRSARQADFQPGGAHREYLDDDTESKAITLTFALTHRPQTYPYFRMPEKSTLEQAGQDKREGKAPSTQAGEFVKEEMDHMREGKHGARSTKQAIAIGLSKARRAGVDLPAPKAGTTSDRTRKQAQRDSAKGKRGSTKVSSKRSAAATKALKREGHSAASPKSLSRQAKQAAAARK
jgi:hypothetical protein